MKAENFERVKVIIEEMEKNRELVNKLNKEGIEIAINKNCWSLLRIETGGIVFVDSIKELGVKFLTDIKTNLLNKNAELSKELLTL